MERVKRKKVVAMESKRVVECLKCGGKCREAELRGNRRVFGFVFQAIKVVNEEVMLRGKGITRNKINKILKGVIENVEAVKLMERDDNKVLTEDEVRDFKLLMDHYDVGGNVREQNLRFRGLW
jgi:hypothetical protein